MKKLLVLAICISGLPSYSFADSTQYCSGRKQSCCVSPSQGLGPSWLDGECSQWWQYGYKYIPNNSCKKTCFSANNSASTEPNSSKSLSFSYMRCNGTDTAGNSVYLMRCNGTDTAGNSVYLITYPNSSVVNINGDMLTIVGQTNNGQGVYTQNFLSVFGVLVYDSLVPVNNTSLTIYQFNAVTQALLAQAWLTCQFYGNSVSAPNVIDHQIFKSIKTSTLKSTTGLPFNKASTQ